MLFQLAATQVIPISNPSNIVNFFNTSSGHWIPTMFLYANRLFLLLAGIDLARAAARKAAETRDVNDTLAFTMEHFLVRGAFYMLLIEGPTWLFDIIDSFSELGHKAASVVASTPSGVVADGLNISGKLLTQAFFRGMGFDTLTASAYLMAAVAILIAFAIIAIHLAKFQIETFLSLRGAFIFLGFGGHSLSSPYAERYITLVIAAGVRLMILLLIAGIGHLFVQNWWTSMIDASTYGAQGVSKAFEAAVECWIYASVCWSTPQFVAGILAGTPALSAQSASAFVAPLVQSAIAGLTMIASGGSSVVAAAGGAAAGGGAGMGARAVSFAARMASSGFGGARPQPAAPRFGGAAQPGAPLPSEA